MKRGCILQQHNSLEHEGKINGGEFFLATTHSVSTKKKELIEKARMGLKYCLSTSYSEQNCKVLK